MADAEFNVVSGEPCENTPRKKDGGYICNIHHMTGAGVKRTRVPMGGANPLDAGMVELATELRGRIAERYKFIESADKVPLESFIGLSVIRLCNRDEHNDARTNVSAQFSPRAERVASIAFVLDPEDVVEIALHSTAHMRAVSANGIGSARRRDVAGAVPVEPLLHLPLTPAEREFRVDYAVRALPAIGGARDPHVALHTIPGGEAFVEWMVTRDQLQ